MSAPPPPDDPLAPLEARLGHVFRDRALLVAAVTHLSYTAEHPDAGPGNQRLEYLGDAVLQILIGEALFDLYPDAREGVLSQRRSLLVNGPFLARLAVELGLDRCLRLGSSEENTGGRRRPAALADAFEALVGALYRDAGYDTTRRLVLALYGPLPARLAAVEEAGNPKGRLQELIQPLHGNGAIRYEVVRTEGADHARDYEVAVFVQDIEYGRGRGSSKKLAEEAAARAALTRLG
jgi:ribonuclease-3